MRVFRAIWGWIDDRTGTTELVKPILDHPVPPDTGWWYVFGSATLTAFIVQVVTGIALATSYVSSTADAYNSLQYITDQAALGNLLRGMHFWGGSAMILLIGIHMARTFLMGSFKFPREMNWLTGSILLLVTLAMGFTGQLLRWDQNAVWSVVVAAEQAGRAPLVGPQLASFLLAGDTVGGATLSRFFAFHVFFIPAIIFVFIGMHLFLVIRNGISEPPKIGNIVDPKTYRQWYHRMLETRGVPFWPDAAWRDAVFAVGVIAAIFLLALFFGPPPLDKPPDPTNLQAYPRPDWYLLWYFAVLALIPPQAESIVIIGAPALLGFLLFILPFTANKGERSPWRRPWALGIAVISVLMISTLWVAGEQAAWSPDFQAQKLTPAQVASTDPHVINGAKLFYDKGCQYCHAINGSGGKRGPDLSAVGNRMTQEDITIRILSGRGNMPAFQSILKPNELNDLVTFLSAQKGQTASSAK